MISDGRIELKRRFNLLYSQDWYDSEWKMPTVIMHTDSMREMNRFFGYLSIGSWFKENISYIYFIDKVKAIEILASSENGIKSIRATLRDSYMEQNGKPLWSRGKK